ncbi:MAG: hypothetical protein IJZ19_16365 [Lentisphaeria bacterium]|nr:hypothetical protein [Lentisphaeria bacterium]
MNDDECWERIFLKKRLRQQKTKKEIKARKRAYKLRKKILENSKIFFRLPVNFTKEEKFLR